MIDIKNLALELEVTRQTIYNHIQKNKQELKPCMLKQQGVTFITSDGIRIIKESMGLIKVPVVQEKQIGMEEVIKEISDNINTELKQELKESMENVKEDIKQDYNKLENELAEVKKQNEILIQMIQDQQEKQEEKKGFFDIFKRK